MLAYSRNTQGRMRGVQTWTLSLSLLGMTMRCASVWVVLLTSSWPAVAAELHARCMMLADKDRDLAAALP